MRNYILLLTCISLCYYTGAQTKKNPFQMVNVPDTIYKQLENVYIQERGSAGARINIFNLEDSKDFVFKNGIYSYRLSGPHFQRRLFIYNNSKLYIFTEIYIDDVIEQYMEGIKYLDLSVDDKICYLKIISEYLQVGYDDYTKRKK